MPYRLLALVALLALLSATPTRAACAWVLWGRALDTTKDIGPYVWTAAGAFSNRKDCLADLEKLTDSYEKAWKSTHEVLRTVEAQGKRSLTGVPKEAWGRGIERIQDFVCLPDTIDPRK
jgi:hypothetical protein